MGAMGGRSPERKTSSKSPFGKKRVEKRCREGPGDSTGEKGSRQGLTARKPSQQGERKFSRHIMHEKPKPEGFEEG